MPLHLSLAVLTGSSLALASSAHCAVMCGPLALASRVRHGHHAGAAYFFGRLVSYTIMGSLAGGAGHVLRVGAWARGAEAALSWALAASLLYTAYRLLRGPAQRGLIKLGRAPQVSRIGSLLARLADEPLLLGAATALLPCAALFSALVAAASLGTALHGALAMSSFAAISGLVVVGVGQLAALRLRLPMLRQALVVALLLGAALTLYRPLPGLRADDGAAPCPLHGSAMSNPAAKGL